MLAALPPKLVANERKKCENCGHPPSATGRKHVPHSNRCEQTKRRGGWEKVRLERAALASSKPEKAKKATAPTDPRRVVCPECGHQPAKTGRRHMAGSNICKRKSGKRIRRGKKKAGGGGAGALAGATATAAPIDTAGKRGAVAPLAMPAPKKAKPLNECTQAII